MLTFRKHFSEYLCIILFITIICFSCCFCENEQNSNNECIIGVDCEENEEDVEFEKVLSRKKRAITFPEGSSLQLVYDQTMPIVAAQLLFTVGANGALAFSLPDMPLYHITSQLRENLQKRLHPELFTTTAAPTNDSMSDSNSRIDSNGNDLKYVDNKQSYYNSMNKHNYYYASDKKDGENDDMIKKVVKTYKNKYGQKVTMVKIKSKKKKKLGNLFLRKHNRVYPVFGKRSVDDHLTDEDIFYMDHHRNSRFEAYEKIETFLKGRGKDGTACVLRALCETAQKNQSAEKAPFLIEILRAIFSLPHQVLPYKKASHQHYEDAHANVTADCARMYPQCKDSIWSPDFRF